MPGDPGYPEEAARGGTVPPVADEYPAMLDGDPVPLRPSARPDIFTDERMKDHVRLRHIDRGSDGTLFPEEWSESEVFTAIDAVLTQPGSVQATG